MFQGCFIFHFGDELHAVLEHMEYGYHIKKRSCFCSRLETYEARLHECDSSVPFGLVTLPYRIACKQANALGRRVAYHVLDQGRSRMQMRLPERM